MSRARRRAEIAIETALRCAERGSDAQSAATPDYLRRHYRWAYLDPATAPLLDHSLVVSTILWGNARRLIRALLDEIESGQRVWQTACVYGSFSRQLADKVGASGRLDVTDVASLQIERSAWKLQRYANVRIMLDDAGTFGGEAPFDAVCCFFLLHEVPEYYKHLIVNNALRNLRRGGKAVFIDYHQPSMLHPLRGFMQKIFRRPEPFAEALWHRDIESYARGPDHYRWRKSTYFGGLYQKVVAVRLSDEEEIESACGTTAFTSRC